MSDAQTLAPGAHLTLTQREVLRAAHRGGRLERSPAGGVHAIDTRGKPLLPRFPLRTVNRLVIDGFLAAGKHGWQLTEHGKAAAGEG